MVRHILHVENAEKLQRALLCDALLAPVLRQAEHCRTERVFRLVVKADENVVEHRQIAEQADILEGSGNAHLVDLNGGLPCCVHAVEQYGTARRLIDLGKKVKNGRLTRAVRADQTGDLSSANGEVEVADSRQTTKVNTEVARFENRRQRNVAFGDDVGCGNRNKLCLGSFSSAHCQLPPYLFSALAGTQN